jgi:hypothetical protein
MAITNLKSNQITNRDATPKILTDAGIGQGSLNHSQDWIYSSGSDSAGSQWRICQVPSESFLWNIEYMNAALGSGCVLDIAAWYPTNFQSGGGAFLAQSLTTTLISSNAFSAQITGNTANATFTSGLSNTATGNYSGINYLLTQPLWQVLGLSSDPQCDIDVGFSVRLAVASAGYVGMKCTFSF